MSELVEEKRKAGRPAGSRGRAKVPALIDRLMVSNKGEIKQIIERAPRKIDSSADRGPSWSERLRIEAGTNPNHSKAISW